MTAPSHTGLFLALCTGLLLLVQLPGHGPTLSAAACAAIDHCNSCPDEVHCLQCDTGRFLFDDTACVANCNAESTATVAYYNNVALRTCDLCHHTCARCVGPALDECTKCQPDAGFLLETTCVASCPISTFAQGTNDDASGRTCQDCAPGCAQCSNPTTCTACLPNWYIGLDNATCVQACPNGFGGQASSNTSLGGRCVPCDNATSCRTCTSSAPNSCIDCFFDKLAEDGFCVDACQVGFFNSSNTTCTRCGDTLAGCTECDAAGATCLVCDALHYLDQGTCHPLTTCSTWTYEGQAPTATTDRLCVPCPVCPEGSYLGTPCQGSNTGVCTACLTAQDCPDSGSATLSGSCGLDFGPHCAPPASSDPAPAHQVQAQAQVTFSNVAPEANATASQIANALRTVFAWPDETNLTVFNLQTPTADARSFYARARVPAALGAGLHTDLSNALRSDDFRSALGANFNNAAVAVSALPLRVAAAGPTTLTTSQTTSNSTWLAWDSATPSAHLEGYYIRAQNIQTSQALFFTVSGTDRALLNFSLGAGPYQVHVAAIYGASAPEPGRAAPLRAVVSPLACSTGCTSCNAEGCATCAANYTFNAANASCTASSGDTGPSSSSCGQLGAFDLCGTGLIILIVIFSMAFLLLLLLLYCLCTRRRVAIKQELEAADNLEIKDVRFVPKWTQMGDKFRGRMTQSRPLNVSQLEASSRDPTMLQSEYESIPPNAASVDELPSGVESRNRSPSVLPNIHSRVYLSVDMSSDTALRDEYINANYMRGLGGVDRRFILTQAPSPTTCEMPVMTTHGPKKTRKRTIRLNDYKIKLVHEAELDHAIYSRIKLWKGALGPRTLTHVWMLSTGSKREPQHARTWNTVVRDVAGMRTGSAPVVVHCPLGIERGAVFVALDILQMQLIQQGTADVLGTVCQLRQDRGLCINSLEQYRFLHAAAWTFARTHENQLGRARQLTMGAHTSNPTFAAQALEHDEVSLMAESARLRLDTAGPREAIPAAWSLSEDSDASASDAPMRRHDDTSVPVALHSRPTSASRGLPRSSAPRTGNSSHQQQSRRHRSQQRRSSSSSSSSTEDDYDVAGRRLLHSPNDATVIQFDGDSDSDSRSSSDESTASGSIRLTATGRGARPRSRPTADSRASHRSDESALIIMASPEVVHEGETSFTDRLMQAVMEQAGRQ
ncbi:uncharacterized protein MONBRDRAFT_25606 [Monosiga brevicollis MX1]|uniref:protein-tyrosine-phosphatase n=1 Tax=Monosiga brevicollis TaxID=81824 RepID=A9V0M9_MONBE|nr:uncharacterized protein MONBRDRAFT_25606 [Monosiga brevicollis MX1]EDQ88908.1 predicted protein [Monosiga brevicollis MX1]|eukprot:XP_001746013.1 hypothetical protein [Monosiga brevicollis MX1]